MAADDDDSFARTDVAALSGNENVLVLAASPGDETRVCGGFIAESCARGRPPYVAILTDGAPADDTAAQAGVAAARAAAARRALAELGLPEDRLLFIGLFHGTAPREGAILQAVVAGVALVSWREDCNAICVPAVGGVDVGSALAIARAVAVDQRLRLLQALVDPGSALPQAGVRMKLDVSGQHPRLHRALRCLDPAPRDARGDFELFTLDCDFRRDVD